MNKAVVTLPQLREALASLEHEQWQRWAGVKDKEHPLLNIPYSELTEADKDKDREWADRVIALIGRY